MQSPKQVAESLYAMMPHAISPETLEGYGIAATPQQACQITREVLSLNLFWIHSALDTLLFSPANDKVAHELHQMIAAAWATEFNLGEHDPEAYDEEAKARRDAYGRMVREGGNPVIVFTETASILDSCQAIRAEETKQMLALLADLVPVESYGDLLEDIDVADT